MNPIIYYGPPPKLYDLCINSVVAEFAVLWKWCCKDFRLLPSTALLDFYERLYEAGKLGILTAEFQELDIFSRILCVRSKRSFLVTCYHTLLSSTPNITENLLNTFRQYVKLGSKSDMILVEMGLKIGSFFNDGGWFYDSIKFLNITEDIICKEEDLSINALTTLLECYKLRIYAESYYYQFEMARTTYNAAHSIIEKLKKLGSVPNLSALYANFSMFYFFRSEYNESYAWAQKAMLLLSNDVSQRELVEVLRHASNACVVKREFGQAGILIRQAMSLGDILNKKKQLPTFSNVLMDYGFYLLNSDFIEESVLIYTGALNKRHNIYDSDHIYLALAHEELAYALYVNEYCSGRFCRAKEHANAALYMMEQLLPKDHVMLASVKRVKALILEEMGLDEQIDDKLRESLLNTAEMLHSDALKISRDTFGEQNVQTAKHYGNLGRLYQSMKKYDEAEKMHLKAIAIKEELLGPEDYEVGLSIGHLASLYNYHMKKYKEAETLYHRSIEINLNLFGPSYSGLEYDYRGLIKVYKKLSEPHNAVIYFTKMREWANLRRNKLYTDFKEPLMLPKEIAKAFFNVAKRKSEDSDISTSDTRGQCACGTSRSEDTKLNSIPNFYAEVARPRKR